MGNTLVLILVILTNAWIWRIANLNPLIFIILISLTILLWYQVDRKINKKVLVAYLLLLGFLLLLQWRTTTPQSLVILENDEQRIKQERLQFYNPSLHYTRVLFARLKLKDFFEGDLSIAFTRLQRNFFETIDPNVYFFGGHPRERVWANDFEKFPFILIAPFLVGAYQLVKSKNRLIFSYTIFALTFLTLIGHKNNFGPFILFPVLVVSIVIGIQTIWSVKR